MPRVIKAVQMNKCIGCALCMLACARLRYLNYSIQRSAIRIRTTGGVEGEFIADICVACRKPECVEVCRTGALVRRVGGGVRFFPEKCIGCPDCVERCPVIGAMYFDDELNRPIVCDQCGLCTNFCPHDCLIMEEVGQSAQ